MAPDEEHAPEEDAVRAAAPLPDGPAPRPEPEPEPPPLEISSVDEPGGTRIFFNPEPGLVVEKSFTNRVRARIVEFGLEMNGERVPYEIGLASLTNHQELVIRDRYLAVAPASRPEALQRTFERIDFTSSWSTDPGTSLPSNFDDERQSSSDMRDGTVLFELVSAGGRYRVTPVAPTDGWKHEGFDSLDAGHRQVLAEELWEDLDYRVFLPEAGVDRGDRWKIDAEELAVVFCPGGDLGYPLIDAMGENFMALPGGISVPALVGEPEGKVSCRYVKEKRVDKRRVAVVSIAIAIDVDFEGDIAEWTRDAMATQQPELSVEEVELEVSLKGKGELLWDIEGGHLHAFEFRADFRSDHRAAYEHHASDMGKFQTSARFKGQLELEARLTRPATSPR